MADVADVENGVAGVAGIRSTVKHEQIKNSSQFLEKAGGGEPGDNLHL